MSLTGRPVFVAVNDLKVVFTRKPMSVEKPLDLGVEYVRSSYYISTRDVGRGPVAEKLSYTDAVLRMIF